MFILILISIVSFFSGILFLGFLLHRWEIKEMEEKYQKDIVKRISELEKKIFKKHDNN